jgi:glycosyltransferase involved in cell wall biosynthesis
VVPSYNQGQFIGDTIDSILAQDVEGVEILVMDGGSSDQTVDVLRGYGDKIEWVSERDKGQSDAINKGMARVHGDVLAYLNSDDRYVPGALRLVLDTFASHPDVDIIYGNINYIDSEGTLIRRGKTVDFDFNVFRYDYDFICQPASFWRRSVIEQIGMMDLSLRYHMDYDFFMRAAAAGCRFHHVRQPLADFRFHGESKTVSGSSGDRERFWGDRDRIVMPYRIRLASPTATRLLHKALRLIFRGRVAWLSLVQNGTLELTSARRLARRVDSPGSRT